MADLDMTQRIHDLYSAFNRRDSSFVFTRMSPEATWPRAFQGGHVRGQEAVRSYWEEQWKEIDPRVDPTSIEQREYGRFDVEVHQVVRDLAGDVIADSIVRQIYRFDGPMIVSMEIGTDE